MLQEERVVEPGEPRPLLRGALGRTGAVEAGAAGTFARDVVGCLLSGAGGEAGAGAGRDA